jgi:hypothetical protein
MEADRVHTNRAAWRNILSWLEGNALCTTALRILEDGTTLRAGVRFVASRAVRHAVLAFDVRIVRRRNLHLVNGHAVVVVAGHGRMAVQITSDTFALESAFAEEITPAEP